MKAHFGSAVITLGIFSGSILFGFGCRSSGLSYASKSTCSDRGGRVESVCIIQDPNDFTRCDLYQDACVGATISLAAWERQATLERDGPIPPSEREILDWWISDLKKLNQKQIRKDAEGYPEISWLAGTWCKEGGDGIPDHYYIVRNSDPPGSRYIHYTYLLDNTHILGKDFDNLEVNGNYYDIWGWNHVIDKYHVFRIEKLSDTEYAVVYKYERAYPYNRYKNKTLAEILQDFDPEKHVQNPEVFTRCDYKRRR